MVDLAPFIAEFMRQIQRDAAQALADTPADQDAGVIVTPVIVLEGREIELDPVGYYRPAEVAPRG
ncbi:hypothetical protein [Streptomyces zaomyceticus]|uniref:hypothetical protein n=1 Tax=Streptomyces zaomyceticus TaxID=68286 RepID=UPI0037B3E76A